MVQRHSATGGIANYDPSLILSGPAEFEEILEDCVRCQHARLSLEYGGSRPMKAIVAHNYDETNSNLNY